MGQTNYDGRLFSKELVLGLSSDSAQRAYAFRHLSEHPVVNDQFDGRPIVVTFNTRGGASAAYDRNLDGKTLSFEQADDPGLMSDRETGSVWNKDNGLALSGPLKGRRLRRIASFAAFWFAWSDFYPDTGVYAH